MKCLSRCALNSLTILFFAVSLLPIGASAQTLGELTPSFTTKRAEAQSVSAKPSLVNDLTKRRRGTSLTVRNTPFTDREGNPTGYRQQLLVSPRTSLMSSAKLSPPRLSDVLAFNPRRTPIGVSPFEGDEGDQFDFFQGCTGTAEVTVIANEITYGSTGPQVPTRVKYQIGENPPVMLFGGDNAHQRIGLPTEIALQPGEEIYLWGHSAYPDFEDPYGLNIETRSDDVNMAAILNGGDNLHDMLVSKGAAQAPFGMQSSLEDLLGAMVVDGVVQLAENEMIILFELGATNAGSPAFDFNDLVLHVATSCPNNSEVVLRDTIGNDSTLTNGGAVFGATQVGTNHAFVPTFITTNQAVQLSAIEVVLSPNSSTGFTLSAFDYEVRVWRGTNFEAAHQAVLTSPLNGNLAPDLFFNPLTAMPPVWGTATTTGGVTVTARRFSFDISAGGYALVPGETYVVALAPRRNGGAGNGTLNVVETTIQGASDRVYAAGMPGGGMMLSEVWNSVEDGNVGIKLVAATN